MATKHPQGSPFTHVRPLSQHHGSPPDSLPDSMPDSMPSATASPDGEWLGSALGTRGSQSTTCLGVTR
jgi:hypothetical protein